MSEFTKIKKEVNSVIDEISESFVSNFVSLTEEIDNWLNSIDIKSTKTVKNGRKRNAVPAIQEIDEDAISEDFTEETAVAKRHCSAEYSANIRPTNEVDTTIEVGRSKRTASRLASESIAKQVNLKLSEKLRRPEGYNKFEVQIKQEKLSFVPKISTFANNDTENIINNEMPPPSKVPGIRAKKPTNSKEDNIVNEVTNLKIKEEKPDDLAESKRSTRSKTRTKRSNKKKTTASRSTSKSSSSRSKQRTSDDEIEIHTVKNSVINLSDSDDEPLYKKIQKSQSQRSTVPDKSTTEMSEKDQLAGHTGDKNENNQQKDEEKSVYEDAQENNSNIAIAPSNNSIQPCFVQLEKLEGSEANRTFNIDQETRLQSHQNEPDNNARDTISINTNSRVVLNETITIPSKTRSDDKNKENFSSHNKKQITTLNETVLISKKKDVVNNDTPPLQTPVKEKKIPILVEKKNFDNYLKPRNQENLIFSPADPVKKRVAAIEKLNMASPAVGQVQNTEPVRVTRTKTRALKAASAITSTEGKENFKNDEEKNIKGNTPLPLERITQLTSGLSKSTTKLNNIVTSCSSFIHSKPVTATRTRSETRDDEQRRKERDEEVQRKKEALLLAKSEEQRRKREEKAQKAREQREQKERERQLLVEKQEREKLEKQKQLQAERDNYLKKELQRKKAVQEKRAQETEERRRAENAARQQRLLEQEEVERRQEAQRKREQEEAEKLHQLRLQEEAEQAKAKARAQKLAADKAKQYNKLKKLNNTPSSAGGASKIQLTPNVKDLSFSNFSTDSEKPKSRIVVAWARSDARKAHLRIQKCVTDNLTATLFSTKPTTINLKDLFPDYPNTERKSSGVWQTPPRYSQMPKY